MRVPKLLAGFLAAIIITLGLSVSLQSLLAAWISPSSAPPDGNIPAPINASAIGQSKDAGLVLNHGNVSGNGLVVEYGNVGIGTAVPSSKMEVAGDLEIANLKKNNGANFFGGCGSSASYIYQINSDGTVLCDLDSSSGGTSLWSANGSEIYYIGNVGIGIADPANRLSITVDQTTFPDDTPLVGLSTTGTASPKKGSLLWLYTTRGVVTDDTDLFKVHNSSGLTLFTVRNSGNVGIGAGSPRDKLHISNPGSGNQTGIYLEDPTAPAYGGRIYFDDTSNTLALGVVNNSVETLGLVIHRNSGNVGIGTTDPGQLLDVAGNIGLLANINQSGTYSQLDINPYARVRIGRSTNNSGFGVGIFKGDSSTTQNHWFAGNGNSYLAGDNGNVGIGLVSPTEKLHVEGDIKIQTNSGAGALHFGDISDETKIVGFDASGGSYLGFYAGSSERVRINSGGNVGIGTVAPNSQLHVKTASGNAEIDIQSASSGYWGIYQDDATDALRFWNTDNRMTIQSGGNVGIGTTNPGQKLDVAGNIGLLANINQSGTNSQLDINPYARVRIGRSTNNSGFGVGIFKGDSSTTQNHWFAGNGNSYLAGDNGNVGIGLVSPTEKLHVEGDIKIQTNSGAGALHFGDISDETKIVGFDASGGSYLGFYAGSSERVRINSGGNVGIGTTDPGTDKLDVRGRAYASGGWQTTNADYAEWFEKEENSGPGDIIGINLETGKARVYRPGDRFIGIHSADPAYVGNRLNETDEEMAKTHILVGLLGQLDFNREQAAIDGKIVKTLDGEEIGVLLSNGKVFIGR